MISLVVKTTLFLCIIEAVASVPQQGATVWNGPPRVQPLLQNIRQRNQQSIASTSSQPFTSPGPQVFVGWSFETNACIIGNDDWSLDIPVTLNECKNHCQILNGCISVEWNTQDGKCNLSKANSRSRNFQQRCPTSETPWLFTELIAIPTQNEIQNQPSRTDDRFQQVGQSPSTQNDLHQANRAPSLVQTVRPSPTNTNQQVDQTTQQSGSSVSQNGRPQAPQNGANEGNAATNVTQHFQPATHRPNKAQATGAVSPASANAGASTVTSGISQEKPSECQRIPSPGECRGAFPRFFYNSTMDQCDCFLYGGCGNEALESSWLTLTECTDTCRPRNTQEGPRCRLLPKQDIQTFTQPSTDIENFDTSHISDKQLIDILQQTIQQPNQQNNKFETPVQ